jgi:hypothetical protein
MSDFKIGDTVWLIYESNIWQVSIAGIDKIGGQPKYWLDDHFGYFDKSSLFRTNIEAYEEANRRWAASNTNALKSEEDMAFKKSMKQKIIDKFIQKNIESTPTYHFNQGYKAAMQEVLIMINAEK